MSAFYLTAVKPADIFNYYDEQLKKHGWQYYGTSGVTDWGRNFGRKSACYYKDENSAQLDYAGEQEYYGSTYGLDMSWGVTNCEVEVKGGWVKQTVPVSLVLIVFGSFLVIYAVDIAKNAWTKDAIEYAKWLRKRYRIKSEKS